MDDSARENISALQEVVDQAAKIFSVPMSGISTIDSNSESIIVSHGVNGSSIDIANSISKSVFGAQDAYIYGKDPMSKFRPWVDVSFYAGVQVENDQKISMCLWIQDFKKHVFTKRDLEILKSISSRVTCILQDTTKITSNDAKRLIRIQKELFLKNRKLAEASARNNAMLTNIGDGVIGVDGKGDVIYANPQVEKLTGWKEEELVGKPLVHALSLQTEEEIDVPVEERPIRNAMYNNQRIESRNTFLVRKDKSKFSVEITATPVNLFGQVVGGVSVIKDITKEHDIDKMKTEFISLASHQLRTPLSSMKWFCEMLIDGDAGDLSDEQMDMVKSVYESNERMIVLVNTLLNISRIESGRIIIEPSPTDISELVNDVIEEIKPKILNKHHTVNVNVDPAIGKVNIDPKMVREVYKNLLTNAIKYMDKNGTVDVNVTKSGNEIISKVKDNGVGIPLDEQKKVFKKFFRAKNVVKKETEGTGLGLYLVYSIVQTSGGKIWFESKEGSGTTFTFVLPLSGSKAKEGEVRLS